MTVTIKKKVTGKEFNAKDVLASAKVGMSRGMQQSGKELVTYIKNSMLNGSKSGSSYLVTRGLRKGQTVRASSPASPTNESNSDFPAVRSGDLLKTVGSKTQGSRKLIIGAGNSNVDYAKNLEETRHFLERTARTNEKQVEANIVNQIHSEFKSKGFIVRKK